MLIQYDPTWLDYATTKPKSVNNESELDTLLCSDARLKRMFYFSHLGHEIGGFDQIFWCVATGDHDVKRGLAFAGCADFRQYFIKGQHVVAQHVHQLIKDEQIIFAAS